MDDDFMSEGMNNDSIPSSSMKGNTLQVDIEWLESGRMVSLRVVGGCPSGCSAGCLRQVIEEG
jgi:hypothetical protein